MKKFALALMAATAVVFGFGLVANAYPPGEGRITISDSVVGPGDPVTVTVTCQPGELVTFELEGSTDTDTCSAATLGRSSGTATGTVTAPTEPGTYTGTATGSETGLLGTFVVVVEGADADDDDGAAGGDTPVTTPSGGLPATGSSGIGTTTGIAVGLLVVGLGLLTVATVRRRQATIG